jgi:predicted ferric reductase
MVLGINVLLGNKEEDRINEGFKLKFYASFQSRADAVGLELLEALSNYCKKHGKDNFELVLRLSDAGKQRRWDAGFIKEQLGQAETRKVWVCGPPVLTETFDRCFAALKRDQPDRYKHGILDVL